MKRVQSILQLETEASTSYYQFLSQLIFTSEMQEEWSVWETQMGKGMYAMDCGGR